MRIYIIAKDGITLSREAPAAMTEGEIAVTSKEELHAAPLNAKRLLALWNALPSVEKRRKVGDRAALIDELWTAIEALPEPEPQSDVKRPSKQAEVLAMLRRPEGATVDEVASAMSWQRYTVRGLFSGTLKKKLGLTLVSAQEERGRVYRIAAPEQACAARFGMLLFAGRRSRASPNLSSASFVSNGALSTNPTHPRISAASCFCKPSHTACRKSLSAGSARSGCAS